MTCLRFSTSAANACRNSTPGVSTLYIANYSDVVSYIVDVAGTSVSGITMSGSTKFYTVAQNKQVASLIDTASINVSNGTAVSRPKITFKVQGLTTDTIKMYKELLQADVVVIVKAIDGSMFAIGLANGLSMITGTLGTEATVDGFAGLSAELEGIESVPFYRLTDAFATTFLATLIA